MKQQAHLTVNPTPQLLSDITGESVEKVIEQCAGQTLFTRENPKDNILSTKVTKEFLAQHGLEVVDHRNRFQKYNSETAQIVQDAANLSLDYAEDIQKVAPGPIGSKIASKHFEIGKTLMDCVRHLNLQEKSLLQDLSGLETWHKNQGKLHQTLPANPHSNRMIPFHNNTAKAVGKARDLAFPTSNKELSPSLN